MKIYKTLLFAGLLFASKSISAQVVTGQWQPVAPNDVQPLSPLPQEGLFGFYQEWNGTGNLVLTYGNHSTKALNLKKTTPSGANDRIKSMVLQGPLSNTQIVVFDNPDGQTDDDYAVIKVEGTLPPGIRVVIPSFDIGAAPGVFWDGGNGNRVVEYFHYHNGLDGKISHISRAVGQ
jgi:hypothetical protein